MQMRPLAVDLDGTLIRGDLIEESLIRYLAERPWRIVLVLLWWIKGRAFLKMKLAERVAIDPAPLPYNEEILIWLKEQKAAGRELLLVSGSDQSYVTAVSNHCKIFVEAKGSDGKINCIGTNKATWLEKKFGYQGFDYLGNSRVDLKVWNRSHSAYIVSSDVSLGKNLPHVERRFLVKGFSFGALFKALRIHQWVKALLVFVPIVAGHRIFDLSAVISACLAFFSFSFISSATYLLNDIVDLESDRTHPKKCNRPFASGALRPFIGLIAAIVLAAFSLSLAYSISIVFLFLIVLYALGSLTYSLFAKSIVVADIVLLAGFYTLRILAGGVAVDVTVSKWLLLFSIFFFLGLACIKRFSELASVGTIAVSRRGYQAGDLPLIRVMGLCSGFIAVLVIALWANSYEVETLYHSPQFLWLLCPLLLYWVGRIWLLAERGVLHHDPVVFALTDRVSYVVLTATLFLAYMAASFRLDLLLR